MMINRYVIYSCYEYFGTNGKGVSSWFRTGKIHKTKEEAEEELKVMKELSTNTDKATKLKHFFDIRYEDITQYPIPTYHFNTKGRPSNDDLQKRDEYYAHYWDRYL